MSGTEHDRPEDEVPAAAEETGVAAAEPGAPAAVSVEELEALRRERDDLKDQLLRRRAEFENYRRRVDRERQQVRDEATAGVLKAILPALDNFERALATSASPEALREGLELTYRDLQRVLEAEGVRPEDPAGQPFDPERQQALSYEHVPGFADGLVVEVFRKGYVLKDRLLRPALVKVSRGEEAQADGGAPLPAHEAPPKAVH